MTLADGLIRNEDGVTRCWWGGGGDPAYRAYHDDEWGTPVTVSLPGVTTQELLERR